MTKPTAQQKYQDHVIETRQRVVEGDQDGGVPTARYWVGWGAKAGMAYLATEGPFRSIDHAKRWIDARIAKAQRPQVLETPA